MSFSKCYFLYVTRIIFLKCKKISKARQERRRMRDRERETWIKFWVTLMTCKYINTFAYKANRKKETQINSITHRQWYCPQGSFQSSAFNVDDGGRICLRFIFAWAEARVVAFNIYITMYVYDSHYISLPETSYEWLSTQCRRQIFQHPAPRSFLKPLISPQTHVMQPIKQ